MARRSKKIAPTTETMIIGGSEYVVPTIRGDSESDTVAEKLTAIINKALVTGDGPEFTVVGTPNAAVQYEDGTYKTKPLVGGEEFTLTNVRHGKRVPFLFVFTPVDSREYSKMEMGSELACELSPTLRVWLAMVLNVTAHGTWSEIVSEYRVSLEAKDAVRQEKAEAKLRKSEKERLSFYEQNEDWGSF